MIGFIILTVVSATLIPAGCGQEYAEGRAARTSYRNFDDDDIELAKPAATVVPILKQIDRHNDDGSYTYGFEAADGSFKIETKQADGEVKGKYGYTDATGKLHVVEYGANKYGFQPSGEGITVPPINLSQEPEEEEEYLPRPQPKQTQLRPRPAVQQIRPWEQEREVRVQAPVPSPTPAPVQYRPTQATPHIVYNNAPAPKRPSFFAGAQAVPQQQQSNFDYDEQPAPRPVQRPVQQARPQQPARSQTLASFAQPAKAQQPTYFVPSSQFRQQIQYSDPSARAAPAPQYERPADNFQIFRPEPTKVNFEQFAEPEPYRQEQVRYTAPKAAIKSKGGFLDQLQEQFSLPKGGHPTHNVAFGFY